MPRWDGAAGPSMLARMIEKLLLLAERGTTADAAAVRRTAAIAERAGAAVDVLALVHDPHLEGYLGHPEVYASLRDRLVEERRGAAEAIAAALRKRGLRAEARAVWSHPRADGAAREALSGRAELVVTEPSGPAGRFSHDDWRLVATCPVPVLVARARGGEPYERVVAGVDPAREHGKPASLDLAVLAAAKLFRDLCAARLEVVHCFTPLALIVADSGLDAVMVDDVQGSLEAGRREAFARLVTEAGLPAAAGTIVEGRPGEVLGERAREPHTLLVLGAVPRGPIRSLFIGSTADRVLHDAAGDVLVVKVPGSAT